MWCLIAHPVKVLFWQARQSHTRHFDLKFKRMRTISSSLYVHIICHLSNLLPVQSVIRVNLPNGSIRKSYITAKVWITAPYMAYSNNHCWQEMYYVQSIGFLPIRWQRILQHWVRMFIHSVLFWYNLKFIKYSICKIIK